MKWDYDAVVIGGGVLGCFAARALVRYPVRVALAERREDVCTGISRANTAIVYAGYDTHPGTLKTRLSVRANREFDALCRDLGVPFHRCGSLMVAFGDRGIRSLEHKMEQGRENGVPGLRMLERDEILRMEPALSPAVAQALYCPGVGTVSPWGLCMAAAENAAENGADLLLNTEVTGLARTDGGYLVTTNRGTLSCRAVVNCAGMRADEVAELAQRPTIRVVPTRGEYLVLDTKTAGLLHHVIFHEPEEKGSKGLTLVPTVDGNILLGPSEVPADDKEDTATGEEGLAWLRGLAAEVAPGIPLDQTIRSFAAIRPNPYEVETDPETGAQSLSRKSIGELMVVRTEECPGMVSLIGVKTPGLTCANWLGEYVADLVLPYLDSPAPRRDFQPVRSAPVRVADLDGETRRRLAEADPAYGRVVCRCRTVTEGEILDAIRRTPGAVTLDGVKFRTGAGMGRCQGGYCTRRIVELLARELGVTPAEIRKGAPGSWLTAGEENCHETL